DTRALALPNLSPEHENGPPTPSADRHERSRLVAARIKRQEILHRKVPPTMSFVIWEAELRDQLGGEDVYGEQVQTLREYAELPGVTLQILPLGRTTHAGLDGPFILLETPDYQRLAYMETQRGSHLIGDPEGVGILTQKYAMLRTQALNTEDTRAMLDRLLGEQ
ncbi:DUF5753 domain-containing protein, partial [Streptomyces olivaceus]|uniref:DUF5753 domain-containing protein n=1 Tax=Streptomyces olivaceus TaxID=47716 RepID=UPI0033296414